MKIKNALRLIAVGFIFTLININVTFNGIQVNFTPDFIGWILIAVACAMMKGYTSRNPFYIGGAILLALCDATVLAVELLRPKLDITMYKTGISLFSIFYIFLLLGKIYEIGKDRNYKSIASIRVLKYVYLIVYIIFQSATLAGHYLPVNVLAIVFSISGIAALITAVATAFVLLKMSVMIDEE